MKPTVFICLSAIASLTFSAPAFVLSSAALAADAVFAGQAISTLGNDAGLRLQPNRIAGSGSLVFKDSLERLGTDSSHALSFFLQDGGSLTFAAYAGSDLSAALEFQFARTGKALSVKVSKAGSNARDVTNAFTSFDASRVVDLQIDVHNSENPAHLLIWNGVERDFSEDTALVNSEEGDASPGAGEGMMRGFVLDKAVLFKAGASEVKFNHDH